MAARPGRRAVRSPPEKASATWPRCRSVWNPWPSNAAMPQASWPRCCRACRPSATTPAASGAPNTPNTPHSRRSWSSSRVIASSPEPDRPCSCAGRREPRPAQEHGRSGSGEDAMTRDDDQLRLECGVFGVFGAPDAAGVVALGLHALQHRGQEACGIAAFDGHGFHTERHLGHVADAFSGGDLTQRLPGRAAIGHTRYSTAGGSFLRNGQPMFADLQTGGIAIAHNGNLTNFLTLREQLVQDGAIFQSTSDSEVILHLIARSRKGKLVARFIDALSRIEGGYALVALTNKKLIGVRDPLGIRPLVLGDLDGKAVFASETRALDMVGARFVRDVEHGEMVVVSDDGVESIRPFPAAKARPCVFEYVYFAMPDSVVNGRSVYEVRKRLGRRLAQESGVPADIVAPVPDSGVPAAIGYAQESGIPFEMGIIRNHYVGRTFIQPTP